MVTERRSRACSRCGSSFVTEHPNPVMHCAQCREHYRAVAVVAAMRLPPVIHMPGVVRAMPPTAPLT